MVFVSAIPFKVIKYVNNAVVFCSVSNVSTSEDPGIPESVNVLLIDSSPEGN